VVVGRKYESAGFKSEKKKKPDAQPKMKETELTPLENTQKSVDEMKSVSGREGLSDVKTGTAHDLETSQNEHLSHQASIPPELTESKIGDVSVEQWTISALIHRLAEFMGPRTPAGYQRIHWRCVSFLVDFYHLMGADHDSLVAAFCGKTSLSRIERLWLC
jgi:hypothetical protein